MTKQHAVGIDFGGTKMLGVLVDAEGNIASQHRLPTPYDADELLEDLVELVEILESSADLRVDRVGVGAGGLVSCDGVLHFGPNVGGVTNVSVAAGIAAQRPDLKVAVDNDATCAAYSEWQVGAGQGSREMVLVTLGTGIGSGLIIDGKIARGSNGFAGEHGHMTIEVGGRGCVCGKNGCWEAYASGRALGQMGRRAAAMGRARGVLRFAGAVDDIKGEHVIAAARAGDEQALGLMDEFSRWVAVGVANAVTISDPEVVVVGGGLAEDADLFLPGAQTHLNEIVFGATNRPVVPVVKAVLGERAGAMGAAMMALNN